MLLRPHSSLGRRARQRHDLIRGVLETVCRSDTASAIALAFFFDKRLTDNALGISNERGTTDAITQVADATPSRSLREGTDDRRSSPRTVLAVLRPPVIVGAATHTQQCGRSPGCREGA